MGRKIPRKIPKMMAKPNLKKIRLISFWMNIWPSVQLKQLLAFKRILKVIPVLGPPEKLSIMMKTTMKSN